MYAQTEGFVGAVGDSTAKAHYKSDANITINSGATLQAYDSMNLSAIDTKDNFTVKRDAKGTTRALFGIPIVTHGSGHEDPQDNPNASIVLNGSVESGLGSQKKLTIDKDGNYTSDGVNVTGKEQVGSVTTEDVQSDIDAYNKSKQSELDRVDDLVSAENEINKEAQETLESEKSQKTELEQTNKNLNSAVGIIDDLMKDNEKAENVSALELALEDLENGGDGGDESSMSKFEELLKTCGDDFKDVKEAFETYKSSKTQDNLNSLSETLTDLGQKIQTDSNSSIDMLGKLTGEADGTIKTWDNEELAAFKQTQQDEINKNTEEIGKCESAIEAANKEIESVKDTLAKAEEEKNAITMI